MTAVKEEEKKYSFSEYIELEKQTNERYELFYGEVFNLAGGTLKHNMLSSITANVLQNKLTKENCFAFINDVKLQLDENQFYVYPDVVVTCDKDDLADKSNTIIRNPIVIVEVLSDSTSEYDRNTKKNNYLKLK